MEILATDLNRPANKTVTATNMAWGRTIDQAGDRPLPGKDQILEMFSDRLAVA